jgi:sugar (pentulose or hexulose) kinase
MSSAGQSLAERLVKRRTFALPSFTDSGGPIAGTGGKGRIAGPPPEDAGERSSLAALYCALMCDQSLDAIRSQGRIIIDGPFANNPVFLSILAQLRKGQEVYASALSDGTAAGAAVLALMDKVGSLPSIALDLSLVAPAEIELLETYAGDWLARSQGDDH